MVMSTLPPMPSILTGWSSLVKVPGSNASRVGLVQAEAPQSRRTGVKGVEISLLKMENKEEEVNLECSSWRLKAESPEVLVMTLAGSGLPVLE